MIPSTSTLRTQNPLSMDTKETSNLKVVMVPWLAHGHISPFLELAKKLSKKNFSIYFCSTPINLTSIRPKLADNIYPSVHLVEFHLPSLPELPPHYHTRYGLPLHLMPLLEQVFEMAGPGCITGILDTINPDLVIYDILQPWIQSITMSRSKPIPAIHFQTAGVASIMLGFCKRQHISNPFPEIYLRESEIKKMVSAAGPSHPSGYSAVDLLFIAVDGSCDVVLVKGYNEMDVKYMNFLSQVCKKKVISVGPLLSGCTCTHIERCESATDDDHSEIFEWLNMKAKFSTIFVSFGSESFLSIEEMEELAHGLDGSNVNFVWVIRLPPGEKIVKVEDILLPEGFLERVKERGKIVIEWAPQARILKHSSIGGFLSHCGWSSIMESLSFGVPIIAMPLQNDQPLNARIVVEYGVAMEVLRDENGKLKREDVAKAIREVVMEESGEDVRRKAREVGEIMSRKGDEDIDCLVEKLQKICSNNNKQG